MTSTILESYIAVTIRNRFRFGGFFQPNDKTFSSLMARYRIRRLLWAEKSIGESLY